MFSSGVMAGNSDIRFPFQEDGYFIITFLEV